MTSETDADLPDVKLEDVKQELEPLTGMSVWARMRLSYIDMRRTTRALIDESPSEPRLLVFVLLSDIVFFLSRGLQLVVSPSSTAEVAVPLQIGMWLVGILLIRTMFMYIFAALIRIGGWTVGGEGGWKATRTAVFWASLVAAPAGVFGALVGAGMAHLEPYYPIVATDLFAWPPLLIGPVAFVFFLSAAVAEAHRFERTSPVFVTFSILSVALLVAVIALAPLLTDALGSAG